MNNWRKRLLQINATTLGLLITFGMIALFHYQPAIIERLDLLAADFRFLLRGKRKPGNELVVVAIDEKSIDELGRWPWPYTVQAALVDRLSSYGARVIGYDVVFSSSDTTGGKKNLLSIKNDLVRKDPNLSPKVLSHLDQAIADADHDRIFAEALKRSHRTILGYFFHFSRKNVQHLDEAQLRQYLENIRSSKYNAVKKAPGARLKDMSLPQAYAVESNIAPLSAAARGSGFFSLSPDDDGAIRRYPLIVQYRDLVEVPGEQDYLFPPLAVRMLERYLRGTTIFWIDPLGVEKVAISGRKRIFVPTDRQGELLVNYLGPEGTFPTYSVVDIVKGRRALAPPEAFRRKLVLIGPTALALSDLRVTPFDKAIPGLNIHATVVDNMLHGNFLVEPWWSELYTLVNIVGLGVLGAFVLPRLGALLGGLATFVIFIALAAINYFLFLYKGLWLSAAYPILTAFVLYGTLTLYHYVVEERQKRFIQSAFGTYLSPKVVDQIVRNPQIMKLGGERKEVTAFFSDVAGFTSVSESMSPEDLVSLLNEYLSEMTDIILRYDGTVDKYEGDAIVAFFGAPHPMPDHAAKGCLVCLDMQEAMVRLRAQWRERGMKELYMRIGLNTGSAVIGNMGSRMRMDYTMMGDTVNTAARLEGANKQYDSAIMLGPLTYQQAKEAIEARELDLINVVGKKEPLPIYELLSRRGELGPEKERVVELYQEGLALYRAKEFLKALDVFGQVLGVDPGDGPTKTMIRRCEHYMAEPPPHDWNGAFVMTSK